MNHQPQLPAMPLDFSQPIEVKGSQLAGVIAEAKAQGYHAHRMSILPDVLYRLQFWRVAQATTGPEQHGDPTKSASTAGNLCIR